MIQDPKEINAIVESINKSVQLYSYNDISVEDLSNIIFNKLVASGISARIIGYTYNGKDLQSVQYYKQNKWVNFDYSSLDMLFQPIFNRTLDPQNIVKEELVDVQYATPEYPDESEESTSGPTQDQVNAGITQDKVNNGVTSWISTYISNFTSMVTTAVNNYLASHTADFKGEKGNDGADGATGATGPQGPGFASGTYKIPKLIETKSFFNASSPGIDPYLIIYGNVLEATDSVNSLDSMRFPPINPGSSNTENVVKRNITQITGKWETKVYIDTSSAALFNYVFLAQSGWTQNGNWGLPPNAYGIRLQSQDIAPNNKLTLFKTNSSGTATNLITINVGSTLAVWKLGVTRDSNGNFELFLNGVSQGTVQDTTLTAFNTEYIVTSFNSYYYVHYVKKDDVNILNLGGSVPPVTTLTFNNLNGDADAEYLFTYDLMINCNADDFLCIYPNGIQSNATFTRFYSVKDGGTGVNTGTKMILTQSGWSKNSFVEGELKFMAKSGRKRRGHGQGTLWLDDLSNNSHATVDVYWNDFSTVITSFVLAFSGASNMIGTISLYKMVDMTVS